jgi:hypothetical protein
LDAFASLASMSEELTECDSSRMPLELFSSDTIALLSEIDPSAVLLLSRSSRELLDKAKVARMGRVRFGLKNINTIR